MNILMLKILLSIISGICLGLYLRNVALFVYILVVIVYVISINNMNLKNRFNLKLNLKNIYILLFSIIIFISTCFIDNKYNNLYDEINECYGIGKIVSFAEEKDYTDKYIIKIETIRRFK